MTKQWATVSKAHLKVDATFNGDHDALRRGYPALFELPCCSESVSEGGS